MSGIRSIYRGSAQRGFATATSAPIRVDSTSGLLIIDGAGSGSTETTLIDTNTAQTLTGKTLTSPIITGFTAGATVASSTGTTLTAANSGAILLFDSATVNQLYTLPAPAFGLTFTFIWTVTVTSGTSKIITDVGSTYLQGQAYVGIAAGTGTTFYGARTTCISFNANGTTSGGLYGSIAYLSCVDATHWNVDAGVEGSGSVVTPFSNT